MSHFHDYTPTLAGAENVLECTSNTIREEVRAYRPGLSPELKSMLDWWATKLAADDELANIFTAITRKAGFIG